MLLGDITDFKDEHPARLVNRIASEIEKVSKLCPVYIIRGNHDCKDPNHPFFAFLDKYEDVHFFTHPVVKDIGDTKALFLPHSRHPQQEWTQDLLDQDCQYIFCHQTFKDCIVENGTRMQEGISPRFFEKEMGAPKTCRIYSGDIHVPQKLGPVTYAGAPYHIRFGDKFDPRILLLKDGKELNLRLSTVKKHSVTIKSIDQLDDLKLSQGDQIKVKLRLSKSELVEWQHRKRDVVQACQGLGVHLADVQLETTKRVKLKQRDKQDDHVPTATPQDIIEKFCHSRQVSDEVKDIGLQFLTSSPS